MYTCHNKPMCVYICLYLLIDGIPGPAGRAGSGHAAGAGGAPGGRGVG